jgi:drug/metabolite transporter (DMT)-like permease
MKIPARLALLLVILIWGCSFVATKAALRELSPVTLVFLRFVFGTGLLTAAVLFRRQPIIPPRETWPMLALMGFIGVFIHHLLQNYALTTTTVVHCGWLIGLIPIWSALLSAVFLKEEFGFSKIAGLVGGFTGAVLVITQGKLAAASLRLPSTQGDVLMLLSTVNWAVYSIVGQGTIKSLGATRATAGMMLLGWLMLVPLFLMKEGWREVPQISVKGWGAILFLGLASSGMGYLVWYDALARLEVSRVASFLYLQPLVTLGAAVLLLGESVSLVTLLGGLLVLGSVYLVQRAKSRAPASATE